MNMKLNLLIISSLLLISCKNRIEEISVSEEAFENTQLADSKIDKSNTPNLFQQNATQSLPVATDGNVVLNPPHGQPGHRCDIAVGAPLPNANAGAVQRTPIAEGEALPQVSGGEIIQQAVNQQVTHNSKGERLNPPHGQPGHRCDIPVGAPLNSKPATTSQPATTQVAEQQVVVQPQVNTVSTGTTAEGFSGKPNPAHGQPGHRCDIAVGAILP